MKSKRVKKHAKHVRRLKMAIRKYTQAQTLQSESLNVIPISPLHCSHLPTRIAQNAKRAGFGVA